MLKDQDIICISSIDWDFIWQGHQEIMLTFAKGGSRVLFIENTGIRSPTFRDIPRIKKRIVNWLKSIKGFRSGAENLYIFSPLILPFPYLKLARWINKYLMLKSLKQWMKVMQFNNPIVWIFLPTGITLDIIDEINSKLIIYYCIDNLAASSVSARKIKATEKELLKQADLVFVTSNALYDYCTQYNKTVHIFPFGVSIDNFEKACVVDTEIPSELKVIKKPIIGYVGGIHKWIDQNLVKSLAEDYPDYSFVFVGPFQTDISLLAGAKNIYFLGNKDHQDLPYLIKNFTACIIPYLVSDYTKNVYPTKLNEYLAMGKPVVSTNLPEIEMFNQQNADIVYVGRKAKEFGECIVRAIKEDNEILRKRRIKIAQENSWKSRIEQMSDLIDVTVEKNMLNKKIEWKEDFLAFYHTARRRIARAILVLSLVYLLFFYTPIIWFLAEPLKITNSLQEADTIVVFAGGVGETGIAGQGYEERVNYAVELYKKGYAKNLIFSSGLRGTFPEPYIMKAVAISLGVPGEAILLEEKASSTYENVKFTLDILNKKRWDKIILISSPYHMRRSLLVFRKIALDKEVIYSPLPKSQFYHHESIDGKGRRVWRQINLAQIKAIIHEYSAICYYWLKGYI